MGESPAYHAQIHLEQRADGKWFSGIHIILKSSFRNSPLPVETSATNQRGEKHSLIALFFALYELTKSMPWGFLDDEDALDEEVIRQALVEAGEKLLADTFSQIFVKHQTLLRSDEGLKIRMRMILPEKYKKMLDDHKINQPIPLETNQLALF